MKRRDFLKLTPLVVAPIDKIALEGIVDYSPKDELAGGPDWPEPEFMYGRYRVVWSGWKPIVDRHEITALWCAYCIDDRNAPMYAVSLPNLKGGRYCRGSCFNIHDGVTDRHYDAIMTVEGRRQLMIRGRAYLMWMLDHPDQATWSQWEEPHGPEF